MEMRNTKGYLKRQLRMFLSKDSKKSGERLSLMMEQQKKFRK
jgi:hypothetical protein